MAQHQFSLESWRQTVWAGLRLRLLPLLTVGHHKKSLRIRQIPQATRAIGLVKLPY